MEISEANLRMFIIDVLRHGGGAHFDGLLARLNNDGCIGWIDVAKREFTATDVIHQVKLMIVAGDVVVESMWDGRGVLNTHEALTSEWNADLLLSNTEAALADWNTWDSPNLD